MRDLSAELAFLTLSIGKKYADEVNSGRALPQGAIATEVDASPFKFDDEEKAEVLRALEASFTTTQTRGYSVFSDFKPWLKDSSGSIDFYYWNRLKRYYLEGGSLPAPVVATLDAVTDQILDFSGNPLAAGLGSRRGMVMGHVQSGKTTNYSALICKAADAGYRTIILLAGITNSLRTQTQERLDETFIGKKSVFHALAAEPLPILTYSIKKRFPAYGTSRDKDFTRDPGGGVVFSLAAHNEPIIFVCKKNTAPLSKLRDWLIEQSHGQVITSPLLLIDDEADNASINTSKNPKATTAINAVIREIMALFERRSYVGYTATPFANIFIDPDTNNEMLKDDLFPKHFIKTLDPPNTYVGASRVFADKGDLREPMVEVVKDYVPHLPLNHKADHPVALPPSLLTAIRVFVLTRAIRILRGQGRQHCTMMINVSRFNAIQEKVHGEVYIYLQTLQNAAAMAMGPDALSDLVISEFRDDFEREFGDGDETFDAVRTVLAEAARVQPLTVNMKGGALDYRAHRENGLHVIAIGGLALSRGLTLEGLTVSYILRNTAASDTLMQMARWFGYRPGYEDVCRVYLPQIALNHYREINSAIEELRDEVRLMHDLEMTPEHFGLKVRESPTAIRITAANKMRTATQMTIAQDYSERHLEGYILPNSQDVNQANLEAARAFVATLGAPSADLSTRQAKVWERTAGRAVMTLLKAFRFSPAHGDLGPISGNVSLFEDYFNDRLRDEMKEWDVAIPHPAGGEPITNVLRPDLSFPLRARNSGDVVEGGFRVTQGRNRVADPDDAQIGLNKDQLAAGMQERKDKVRRGDKAFCAQRTRPLLLIHVFTTDGTTKHLKLSGPIVTLSFCLPSTKKRTPERSYQVNAVYRKQIEAALAREDEDDDDAVQAGEI
ncbi:Z1 domain-containing protein [Dyella halodurans]|uniref:Z1 domain-containing protein n=1 Tax=Dyella halodurans TaxID=1920171 RepID=A0ABV9C051_9GAMM|nr:Z1 domain-containing protein [Dyella halodurans]